jgi:hypothetical protein
LRDFAMVSVGRLWKQCHHSECKALMWTGP